MEQPELVVVDPIHHRLFPHRSMPAGFKDDRSPSSTSGLCVVAPLLSVSDPHGSTGFANLERRRAYECRLTRDRALESLNEAAAFLAERGLLTRTPDSSLPSLFEACHEEPYLTGARGFGSWPKTKYPWAEELGERPGITVLKIHSGKSLLLTREILAIVDPICRAELARLAGADRERDGYSTISPTAVRRPSRRCRRN